MTSFNPAFDQPSEKKPVKKEESPSSTQAAETKPSSFSAESPDGASNEVQASSNATLLTKKGMFTSVTQAPSFVKPKPTESNESNNSEPTAYQLVTHV
jgi:hypothetical protein